jgi:hypothetical protein
VVGDVASWSRTGSGGRESECETDRVTEERVSERENDGKQEEKEKKRELGRGRGVWAG